jgi:2-phospho-L-lactate guanylyltransferase
VLVPVRAAGTAKSRLRAQIGERTGALVSAMLLDVVDAAVRAGAGPVLVVSTDVALAQSARALGAGHLPAAGAGLNADLRAAAAAVRGPGTGPGTPGIVVLPADCPCIRSDDVQELALVARAAAGQWFVPDAGGAGTTALVVAAGTRFSPSYGVGSAGRHEADGAHRLAGPRWRRVQRDVDTLADLVAAIGLGAGPRTARAARDAGLG